MQARSIAALGAVLFASAVRADNAQGLSASEAELLYHLPEGDEAIPLLWLKALEDPSTHRPFLEQPERYGSIADSADPNGLPIGAAMSILSAATAPYFTSNPLLNARVGGFFAPAAGDPPLGGVFTVAVVALDGTAILESSGKVVAKQDVRIGVRLTDADKASLDRLRSALAKLVPAAGK